MDVSEIVRKNLPESPLREYKTEDTDISKIVKELTALSNSGGGELFVGLKDHDGQTLALGISDPDTLEVNVQDHAKAKVEPPIYIDREIENHEGKTIIRFIVESAQTLHSYCFDGDRYVLPYRAGTSTHYMHGPQIASFYRENIRPGNPRSRKSGGHEISQPRGDEQNQSQPESSDSYKLRLEQDHISDSNWYFTPIDEDRSYFENWTFLRSLGLINAVSTKTTETSPDYDELKSILAALQQYLSPQYTSGMFTISMRNTAWFGRGLTNFLESLTSPDARRSIPNDFRRKSHHSEGAVFVCTHSNGLVVIRSYTKPSGEYFNEFSISIVTEGIPIDNRSLISFLEATDLDLTPANEHNISRASSFIDGIKIEPIECIKYDEGFSEPWVRGMVCKNPFFQNNELYQQYFGQEEFEGITGYENIYCDLSNHHPVSDNYEYDLQRVVLQDFAPFQSRVDNLNAYFQVDYPLQEDEPILELPIRQESEQNGGE